MAKADETARAVVVALRLVESGILANVMYRYDLHRNESMPPPLPSLVVLVLHAMAASMEFWRRTVVRRSI